MLKKKKITIDEIFADLRSQNISHFGQIERAYLEPSGKISLFLYADNDIKYGLPIFPENMEQQLSSIKESGHYSCTRCGHTKFLDTDFDYECGICHHNKCVAALNTARVK